MAQHNFTAVRSRSPHVRPPASPNPIGIQINWKEEVVKAIRIQHHRGVMTTNPCCIKAKSGCQPRFEVQFALDTQAAMISASRHGRWGH